MTDRERLSAALHKFAIGPNPFQAGYNPFANTIQPSERPMMHARASINIAANPTRGTLIASKKQQFIRAGERSMAQGKYTLGQFTSRLATSTARVKPVTSTVPAPSVSSSTPSGFGGSGYSGTAPNQLGQATTGAAATNVTSSVPRSPQPASNFNQPY